MVWIKHYASKLAQAVSVGLDRRFPVWRTGGVTAQEYSLIHILVLVEGKAQVLYYLYIKSARLKSSHSVCHIALL